MSNRTKWKGKSKPRKAPKYPDGFVREPRGPKVKKPRLYFRDAKAPKGWPKRKRCGKWYIYHHKQDYSTGCGWDDRKAAEAEHAEFCRDVERGREIRKAPGQITFAEMAQRGFKNLERNANTARKLMSLAKARKASVWWLQHFGRMKLIQYRPKHSDDFQTWYIGQRSGFYLKHPESRKSAANGAVTLLRSLKSFCEVFAQDEDTGWYPDIKIPDGEEIAPGPFFRRSEQAAMLLACRGWVKDRKTGKWKTRTYVDETGAVRTTHRVRPAHVVATRKGKSRFIRFGVRTGAREQDLMSVVWGVATHTAFVDVDDNGAGEFHRRGTEENDTNKSRPTSFVPDRLKCLLGIWKKEDGQSKRVTERDRLNGTVRKQRRYLVRQKNGRPYTTLSLASIVRDAGLPANYTEHGLRRTAVEEAHLQCWSMPTASHMIGMTADVLLRFYTDWNERAARSEAQALREANSRSNARALRAVAYTPREDGDRVRLYDREVTRLRARRQEAMAGVTEAPPGPIEVPAAVPAFVPKGMEEAYEALCAANRGVAAHRLRKDDLSEPVPANDRGEKRVAKRPSDDPGAALSAAS